MIAAHSDLAADVPGAHLRRVALSIGTLDLLRFVRYDHAFPRHSHEEFTVGVFESGNGSLGYRRARWRAFDGSVLAVPPDEVHTAEPLAGSGWTYRAMYPSPALVAAALDQEAVRDVPAFFRAPIVEDPPVARLVGRVHRHLAAGDAGLAEEVGLICALRALVLRHGITREPVRPATPAARAVVVAREYLHAHFHEPVKLAALARVCGASPYHLVRTFREVVGMPPHAYLTQLRAHHARARLVAGEPPASVAFRCGFCDQSHLNRAFKRLFGVTPGAYLTAVNARVA